jgi:hypothetical protein
MKFLVKVYMRGGSVVEFPADDYEFQWSYAFDNTGKPRLDDNGEKIIDYSSILGYRFDTGAKIPFVWLKVDDIEAIQIVPN